MVEVTNKSVPVGSNRKKLYGKKFVCYVDKTVEDALGAPIIKLKAWPCEWKPYLAVWKRIQGNIPSTSDSWPWSLESVDMNIKGTKFSVASATEILRLKSITYTFSQADLFSNSSKKENWTWSNIKWIPNKKKDIFWRMMHNALPICCRLANISPEIPISCPWCPREVQTLDHFILNYRISKAIWKAAYDSFGLSQKLDYLKQSRLL